MIALIVLVVLGAGVVGCIVYTGGKVVDEIAKSVGTADPDDYEISELDCTTNEYGGLSATGKIENTSDKAQAFQVTVRWVTDDNTLITDGFDYTDKIGVGQRQLWEITAQKDAAEGSTPKCEIASVEYTIFD